MLLLASSSRYKWVLEESFYNWFNSGGDELMKKVKLIIAAAAMLVLVSGSAAYADGFAPGEGLYLGVFGGSGMGVVQPKVQTNTTAALGAGAGGTGALFEAKEGGLGLEGLEYGGWLGYGYKMGDFYAGLEGEFAGGDVEFKLTSDTAITIDDGADSNASGKTEITEISAKKDWTGGFFGRVGGYVNPNTLFSLKAGVLVSKFDVAYGSLTEEYYGGGPAFGASLDSTLVAIDPNLSIRVEGVYTDFLTVDANVGIGGDAYGGTTQSEVTGSALSARLGLSYSFFDVNSLF